MAELIKRIGNKILRCADGKWKLDCCAPVPAPNSCPCETWPPESWPCGGLNQTYHVEFDYVLYGAYPCVTPIASCHISMDVTAVPSPFFPCEWGVNADSGTSCGTMIVNIIGGARCWLVQATSVTLMKPTGKADKSVGSTPIGTAYVPQPCAGSPFFGWAALENVVVT